MKAIVLGSAAVSLMSLSALAADMAVPPRFSPPPAPPPFSWTSCYAGVHGAGGFGQKDINDTAGILSPTTGFTTASLNISGYLVGGQIGCDYQFSPNWVVGIEGAAAGGNIGGNTNFALPLLPGDTATFKETTDFLSSVTARVGYAFDRWMVYGKGGVALVDDRYNVSDIMATYDLDGLENRLGWTAGAGVEWAFWEDWSVKLEYDYYGFGTRNITFVDSTISGATGPYNIKQTIQTVKLGLNFHVYAGP